MGESRRPQRAPAGAEPDQTVDTRLGGEASEAILSAAADGIVAVDESGIIRVCNPAAEKVFARPSGELVGTPFGHPIVAGTATEIDVVLPGGRSRVVEMRVTITVVEGKRLYVAALRDVTRRRKVEQELHAALEQQNIVVAAAAHELSNPLAAISVLVYTLRDPQAELTEQQQAHIIDRIAERTAHLQALVRKQLTASRIDAKAAHGPLARVPVLELILERLADFTERAQDVRVSCSPELVALVDRSEFSEMTTNYLENAFAYGRPPIEVRAAGRARWVEIRVCDRGPGVAEEFVPDLFERFSREPRIAQDVEGTGLGLWIVRTLARANGGDAWYKPNKAGGACFWLRLQRP